MPCVPWHRRRVTLRLLSGVPWRWAEVVMTTDPDKLVAAEARLKKARADLARLKRSTRSAERRRLDTQKFLLGSALAAWWDTGEAPEAEFLAFLGRWVRPGDPRLHALDGTPWSILPNEDGGQA